SDPTLSMIRPPPSAVLFPYTTLFRSGEPPAPGRGRSLHRGRAAAAGEQPDGVGAGWLLVGRSHRPRLAGCRGDHPDHLDGRDARSEEHTSELQSREKLVCRLVLEKKK